MGEIRKRTKEEEENKEEERRVRGEDWKEEKKGGEGEPTPVSHSQYTHTSVYSPLSPEDQVRRERADSRSPLVSPRNTQNEMQDTTQRQIEGEINRCGDKQLDRETERPRTREKQEIQNIYPQPSIQNRRVITIGEIWRHDFTQYMRPGGDR